MTKVEYLKIRDVKSPIRQNGNAGTDWYVPNFSKEFMEVLKNKNPDIDISEEGIKLGPQEDILIPSGLKYKLDRHYYLKAANKSGISTKKKMIVGAEILDESYQGESHIHLINFSNRVVDFTYGDKIIQVLLCEYDDDAVNVVFDATEGTITEESFFSGKVTDRGDKGFGEGTGGVKY